MNDVKASGRRLSPFRSGGFFARRHSEESGFTIIEIAVSLTLLAIIAAPLAGVFYSAIRTAGVAAHRTDGASVASREIEGMRAVPYDEVGFYSDQSPQTLPGSGLATVILGATSPAANSTQPPPQIQPVTPDPNAKVGYLPDPNPANANPIVFGGQTFNVARYVMWADAAGLSSTGTPTTFTQAYKQLAVVVTWTDQAGSHRVEQDSLLYPGGLGPYGGPLGGPGASTTTTAPTYPPSAPVLAAITPLPGAAGETQAQLVWSQPPGGGLVSSYTILYSTNPGFPAGATTPIAGVPGPSYPVTGLSPGTLYFFEVIALNGTAPSPPSNAQSVATTTGAAVCTLGGLNVAGAQGLSTTGTILKNNGQMSENLTLSWTTSGPCTDLYEVHATGPAFTIDPGSPYALAGAGSYTGTVSSANQKGWAVGLHTFTVWDVSTGTATTVVKTFKVCVYGVASC